MASFWSVSRIRLFGTSTNVWINSLPNVRKEPVARLLQWEFRRRRRASDRSHRSGRLDPAVLWDHEASRSNRWVANPCSIMRRRRVTLRTARWLRDHRKDFGSAKGLVVPVRVGVFPNRFCRGFSVVAADVLTVGVVWVEHDELLVSHEDSEVV